MSRKADYGGPITPLSEEEVARIWGQFVKSRAPALRDRLIAATRDRERAVQFRGDARVAYGLVIEVMDTLRDAGIENVGMITERPSAPKR